MAQNKNNDSLGLNETKLINANQVSKYYPYLVSEMIISILCLMTTIILLSHSIKRKSTRVPSLIIITLCVSMILTYCGLSTDFILRNYLPSICCQILSIAIYWSFCSTFLWTNVMAYDLRSNITSMVIIEKSYMRYSLFAWITSLLMTGFTVIMDKLIKIEFRPKLGEILSEDQVIKSCFINDRVGYQIFLSAPVGFILLTNLVFYVSTAISLNRTNNERDISEQKTNKHRYE
jgi:large-conductance mechanosensitive channel